MRLSIAHLSVQFHGVPALDDVSLDVAPRCLTALIGPNGAGKSTLLRCIYGLVPYRGQILLGEAATRSPAAGGRSGQVAYLPQDLQVRSRLSALDVVLLGKLGSLAWHVRDADVERAYAVMEDVGVAALARHPITELSVGQRQLVFVAQALIRNPSLLLFDEPTSALDLRHQLELLTLIRRLVEQREATALVALHDLNVASRFADHAVLLSRGRVHAVGTPVEVLTCPTIEEVYGVEAEVHRRPEGDVLITAIRALPGR